MPVHGCRHGNEKERGYTFAVFGPTFSRVQLFLCLNDLAGRWPLLDGAARFFYVGALPALGTLLLAQLLLLARPNTFVSRSKTALALMLALGLGALLVWGFDLLAAQLHLGVLSPRPWMTRRVNWLVVEPQDNSFPCVELVLAAALASASWRLNRRMGTLSWALVVLFALTRMFCGNNYFADVLVGVALGAGAFVLCGAACERHLAPGRRARDLALGASPLALTLAGCYGFALLSPRFEGKLGVGRPATAAPSPRLAPATTTASAGAQGEGEGLGLAHGEGRAEELALAKRSTLFLPEVEAYLRGKLTPLALPFPLLDVEVAPVKAGTTSFRCAAIRFQVPAGQSQTRRLVAERAAKLVRTAFFFDSQLQNVDIIAVASDQGRNLDGSQMIFAGDEVPVFTASVQRKNLIVASPAWANAPGVDGGSWLRARSLLYINERALPASPEPVVVAPTPGASPMPSTPASRATSAPLSSPRPSPTATVQPTSKTPLPPVTSTLQPTFPAPPSAPARATATTSPQP